MSNLEYQCLVDTAEGMKGNYDTEMNKWRESKLKWVIGLPPPTKAAILKESLSKLLGNNKFSVSKSSLKGSALQVNDYTLRIKTSFLWEKNEYKFQQIRKEDNFDILCCLGISPGEAHIWLTPKSEIDWKNIKRQHRGKQGSDTWWISVKPLNSPHSWMLPRDGNLQKAIEHLRTLTTKPVVK